MLNLIVHHHYLELCTVVERIIVDQNPCYQNKFRQGDICILDFIRLLGHFFVLFCFKRKTVTPNYFATPAPRPPPLSFLKEKIDCKNSVLKASSVWHLGSWAKCLNSLEAPVFCNTLPFPRNECFIFPKVTCPGLRRSSGEIIWQVNAETKIISIPFLVQFQAALLRTQA